MYRYEAISVEGFVQQLAANYVANGYWWYVAGKIPERKDPRAVDEKLLDRYGIGISKWARARRKQSGLGNVQYLRHGRFFVLVATTGEHPVFREEPTIRDIRRTIFALGSGDNASDIQAEVTRMVDRAAGTLKFRPALRFEGPVRTRVGADVAPDVLAVLTEALSNAARHAQAKKVTVELAVVDGIRLTVADDGRGMPDDVPQSGLSNMRQRAERRGGHCAITSRPGEGTTVEWWVPS